MQPKDEINPYEILSKPWEMNGVDIFQVNEKNFLGILDYYHKLPIIKCTERLSAEKLITSCKKGFT